MKQQWIVQREGKEYPDGQARWDRAYRLILEIARSLEESQTPVKLEVPYASSDLCESIDSASSSNPNH
jgi:hypothetical protein